MKANVFQNQYRMLYLGARDFDSQSLENSQWDFKCLSTRYAKYLVKKDNFKEGHFRCKK